MCPWAATTANVRSSEAAVTPTMLRPTGSVTFVSNLPVTVE